MWLTDMNRDGLDDLIVTQPTVTSDGLAYQLTISVYPSNGDGTFGTPTVTNSAPSGYYPTPILVDLTDNPDCMPNGLNLTQSTATMAASASRSAAVTGVRSGFTSTRTPRRKCVRAAAEAASTARRAVAHPRPPDPVPVGRAASARRPDLHLSHELLRPDGRRPALRMVRRNPPTRGEAPT